MRIQRQITLKTILAYLSIVLALLSLALGVMLAANARASAVIGENAAPVALVGEVSPEGLLNLDGTLDLSTGFEGALDLSGWDVTLDSERGPVLRPRSGSAAAPSMAWYSLPNEGLDYYVFTLAVVGSDLYVGGRFTQTGDGSLTDLGYIAHYDTTAGAWHALPNGGLSSDVRALAAVGSDLYVGGDFTQTGDGSLTNLGHIVRYDTTAGSWHALPNQGLDDFVFALEVSGSDLYVGGHFTQTGDGTTLTNLGRIARYDTVAGAWNALPSQGLNWHVFALEMVDSNLYVGGLFTQTGDGTTLTNLGHIARYDTVAGAWNALRNQGLNNGVHALATSGSDLYVGGNFTQTGDGVLKKLSCIARYDTTATTWHALPNQGLDGQVSALAVVSSDVYVGGWFTQTGDGSLTSLGRIARYDSTAATWHALPNQGLNGEVWALSDTTSGLYMAGWFSRTGDGSLTNLGSIARYGACHKAYLPLVIRQ